jgi:hypothetical protein
MRRLLVATAVIEGAAGVALLIWPSATVGALVGPTVVLSSAALTLLRLGGAVLLAVGAGAGLASRRPESRAARGVVWGMTLYNLGAAGGLCVPKLALSQGGALLWPAVALHAAMGVWCVICLRRARRPEGSTAPKP